MHLRHPQPQPPGCGACGYLRQLWIAGGLVRRIVLRSCIVNTDPECVASCLAMACVVAATQSGCGWGLTVLAHMLLCPLQHATCFLVWQVRPTVMGVSKLGVHQRPGGEHSEGRACGLRPDSHRQPGAALTFLLPPVSGKTSLIWTMYVDFVLVLHLSWGMPVVLCKCNLPHVPQML